MEKKSKRQLMQDAIEAGRGKIAKKPADSTVTAAAKKENWRSAKARDARAKARGRLPENARGDWLWTGNEFVGVLVLQDKAGLPVKSFRHMADGLFRLMEELDIMFWEWFAAPGDEELKEKLVFNPNAPKPERLHREPEENRTGKTGEKEA